MQVCVNRQLVWWYDVFKLLQMYLLILTVSLHCRLSLLISLCLRQQRPNPSQSENWLSRKRDGNARWVLSSPPISNNFVAEGIWHCVWYVTQYQHMPCMLYFNLALPLGNAVPSISCWLSCICTPKGCFTMPNIWEWWWSQSDGAFLAEDIAKQPLLPPMKRWSKVFR